MVGIIAVPAMAKPNVAFNTGLAIDGIPLLGSLDAGYKFVTRGTDALFDATLVDPTAYPALSDSDDMYPFCLNTNPAEKAKLSAYFEAKGWPEAALAQIAKEIDGTAPFFYLTAVDGVYTLVDGFMYAMFGAQVPLRINDDYPAGLYTYKGTLTNADGDFDLQVKLKVY